jgi:hypothetical protein
MDLLRSQVLIIEMELWLEFILEFFTVSSMAGTALVEQGKLGGGIALVKTGLCMLLVLGRQL